MNCAGGDPLRFRFLGALYKLRRAIRFPWFQDFEWITMATDCARPADNVDGYHLSLQPKVLSIIQTAVEVDDRFAWSTALWFSLWFGLDPMHRANTGRGTGSLVPEFERTAWRNIEHRLLLWNRRSIYRCRSVF